MHTRCLFMLTLCPPDALPDSEEDLLLFGTDGRVQHVGVQVMRKKDLIRKNLVENACFEKEIMSSANNPFIVRSFYSFTSRDNLFLVMEWISGGDTASLLKSMGALDEDVARQYIAETILALEWCHSQVVHAQLTFLSCCVGATLSALIKRVAYLDTEQGPAWPRRASFTATSSQTTCSSLRRGTSRQQTLGCHAWES